MEHKRHPRHVARHDDVTSHAGWLAVSLVLGILAVAVAASTVVPKIQATEVITETEFVYVQRYEQTFENAYDLDEATSKTIQDDVVAFLAKNGLPADTVIVQAQFIGGYDETTELMADGVNRATTFQARIKAEDPTLFLEAGPEVTFDGTNKVFPDKVVVRFRFGEPVA